MKYHTICADPPWPIKDKLPGPGRGSVKKYDLISMTDLLNYNLPDLASDCRLFLWRLASMQQEAIDVMKAWGFKLKAEVVWLKRTPKEGKIWFGMGRQVRMAHEVCLIGVRGHPKVLSRSVRSVYEAPWVRHSGKPEGFYKEIVEKISPGPYCELFARTQRPGWTCIGREIRTGM